MSAAMIGSKEIQEPPVLSIEILTLKTLQQTEFASFQLVVDLVSLYDIFRTLGLKVSVHYLYDLKCQLTSLFNSVSSFLKWDNKSIYFPHKVVKVICIMYIKNPGKRRSHKISVPIPVWPLYLPSVTSISESLVRKRKISFFQFLQDMGNRVKVLKSTLTGLKV